MYNTDPKPYTFDRTGDRLIYTYDATRKMLTAMNHLYALPSYFTQKETIELKKQKLL